MIKSQGVHMQHEEIHNLEKFQLSNYIEWNYSTFGILITWILWIHSKNADCFALFCTFCISSKIQCEHFVFINPIALFNHILKGSISVIMQMLPFLSKCVNAYSFREIVFMFMHWILSEILQFSKIFQFIFDVSCSVSDGCST